MSSVSLTDLMDIAEDCARYVTQDGFPPVVFFFGKKNDPERFDSGQLPTHPCIHPKELVRMLILATEPTAAVVVLPGAGVLESTPELEALAERAKAGDDSALDELRDLPNMQKMIAVLGEDEHGARQHRLFLVDGERPTRSLIPIEPNPDRDFYTDVFPLFGIDPFEALVTAAHQAKHGLHVSYIKDLPLQVYRGHARSDPHDCKHGPTDSLTVQPDGGDWIERIFSGFGQPKESGHGN